LSGALKLGAITGVDWRMIVYVAQAIIFALIYPAIYYMGRDVFGLTRRVSIGCVGFTVFSGAFISYTPIILSDAMFATALITGMVCGFYALGKRSITWSLLHIVAITYAATVRPMLAFYPFAAACMHWAYIRSRYRPPDHFRCLLMAAMFLFTLIGVQTPAARNWVNHGVFTPSENGFIIFYDYLARDVLGMKKELARYEQVQAVLAERSDHGMMGDRIAIRKRAALRVYRDYPVETAAFMLFYGMLNSLEMHWNNTLFYLFRQTWYRDYADGSVRWSPLPFVVGILFVIVYGYIYSAAIFLAATMRKNVWVITSVLVFLVPYAFCSTNYQGARMRLWFEPLLVLAAAMVFQEAYKVWLLCRESGPEDRQLRIP